MVFEKMAEKLLKVACTLLMMAGIVLLYHPLTVHSSESAENIGKAQNKRVVFGWNPTRNLQGGHNAYENHTPRETRAELILFVQQTYQNLLWRDPTATEVTHWIDALQARTVNKAEIPIQLVNGAEFSEQTAPIVCLYQAFFSPIEQPINLLYWLDLHHLGLSLTDISDLLVETELFSDRYGKASNKDFVILVYQAVFSRQPDPAGLEYWSGLLDTDSLSRSQLMLKLSQSEEGQQKLFPRAQVTMLMIGLLNRVPEHKDFTNWTNQSKAGNESNFVNELLRLR